jgi:CAAX prenyl protease-like protein
MSRFEKFAAARFGAITVAFFKPALGLMLGETGHAMVSFWRMQPWIKKLRASPALVRTVPFVIFVLLTAGQGKFGEASRYWIYLLKSVIGVGLIWLMRPAVPEMRWKLSWAAVVTGVGVCVIWVGLDAYYPKLGAPGNVWNPNAPFGQGSNLAWLFIAVRILGSTLVVPPLEEVFYRSFVYRYIIKPDFQAVPLGVFQLTAFVVTAVVFGFSHYEWLAGILCAFAYQGLVLGKKRLGDAMTAHAITNFLLGCWVVGKGAWHFW